MSDDLEIDLDAIQRRMDGAMNALKQEFASLRTGRASASIVEPIQVDAYGQMTPINQLGTVNVPEPRMVVINVWDKAMIGKIEKAIRESGIGINPVTDGPLIRLPIPELNEQRRKELTKVAAQYAESAKVAMVTRTTMKVKPDQMATRWMSWLLPQMITPTNAAETNESRR